MNAKQPLGVVMLPMIFGTSLSFRLHTFSMRMRGYPVCVVDPYKNQKFKRPFFANVIGKDEKRKLTALAESFNDTVVLNNIDAAVSELMTYCERVALVGFGLGGIYALWYAKKHHTRGVIAWYPHLLFPAEATKKPPDLTKIHQPVLLFYGDHDDKIEAGTVELARHVAKERAYIESHVFLGAGHAFADATVQYCIPNPLWRWRASGASWKMALKKLRFWSE